MSARRTGAAAALACLVLVAALLWLPRGAWAHAVVVNADPPDHAVLAAAPRAISLQFNARLEKRLTRLWLEQPGGSRLDLEDRSQDAARIAVSLPEGLAPGAYVLHYQVLATDGHATQGVLRFRVDDSTP